MRAKEPVLALLLPVLLAGLARAGPVTVRLHTPPPKQLTSEHLWWADLDNTSRQTFKVYLYAEVREAGQGLVFKASTHDFQLLPGLKRVRMSDITVKDRWAKQGYEVFLVRTGRMPPGDYTYSLTVMPDNLGGDTVRAKVEQPTPPRLLTPVDGEELKQEYPVFTWTAPGNFTGRPTYKLKVVEVKPGQTKEQALQFNPPHFEKDGIPATSYHYPASGRRLEPDKKYAWKVEATLAQGQPVLSSSIWGLSRVLLSKAFYYIDLKVTRTVTRSNNWFEVKLEVSNIGSRTVKKLVLYDSVIGFQPTGKAQARRVASGQYSSLTQSVPCEVTNNSSLSSARIKVDLTSSNWNLAPGSSIRVYYWLVPALYDITTPTYTVGKTCRVTYQADSEPRTLTCNGLVRDDLGPQVNDAFWSSSFLVVSRPEVLNMRYSSDKPGVTRLCTTMGEFAKQKSAVLGYFINWVAEAGMYRSTIMNQWKPRVNPNWSQLHGYLLLVGENDIIPAWTIPCHVVFSDGVVNSIPLCDFPYADPNGDLIPDIKVARVIGRSPTELRTPLEQSLAVWNRETDRTNDMSNAMLHSGYVNGDENFKGYTSLGADVLRGKGVAVAELHYVDLKPEYQNWDTMFVLMRFWARNKDLLIYDGHGHPAAWSGSLGAGGVSGLGITSPGKTRPVAMGLSCLTGRYDHPSGSIARAFLANGAPVYLGATTELAVSSANWLISERFWHHWSRSIRWGDHLRNLKAELAFYHPSCQYTILFVRAFNYYGDPTFGGRL